MVFIKGVRLFFNTLILSILATSCGDFSSNPPNPGRSTPPPEAYGPGILDDLAYGLEDRSCLKQQEEISLKSATYSTWDGREVKRQRLQAPQIQGSPVLSSALIKKTFLPRTFHIRCLMAPGVASCQYTDPEPTTPLKLCRSSGNYLPQSLESVALTSLVHLEKAHLFYQRTNPSSKEIPQSQLFVHPKFTTTHLSAHSREVMEKNTVHDNLSYIHDFYETPAFVIHPPSDQAHAHGLRLWQYPWALAHEFAHHILASHSEFETDDIALKRSQVIEATLPTSAAFSQSSLLSSFLLSQNFLWGWHKPVRVSSKMMKRERSWKAFNEAYADLWAFYATGRSSSSTAAVNCLKQNRDVSHPHFQDGTPKRITKEALQSFYSPTKSGSSHSCHAAHFPRIHVFGAALAHSLYRIHLNYQTPHKANAQMIQMADHLALLLKDPHFNMNMEEFTALAIHHLLRAPSRENPSYPELTDSSALSNDTHLCEKLQVEFPGMISYWQQRNYFGCNESS